MPSELQIKPTKTLAPEALERDAAPSGMKGEPAPASDDTHLPASEADQLDNETKTDRSDVDPTAIPPPPD